MSMVNTLYSFSGWYLLKLFQIKFVLNINHHTIRFKIHKIPADPPSFVQDWIYRISYVKKNYVFKRRNLLMYVSFSVSN